MQILVTIGSGVMGWHGVKFDVFPFTFDVVLITLALLCQSVIIGISIGWTAVGHAGFQAEETSSSFGEKVE